MQPSFAYHRPATRAEALELLARPGYHAVPLVVHPKPTAPRQQGAEAFVDLSLLGLGTIQEAPDGSVRIGALATLQAIVESPLLDRGALQLLARAAELVAGPGIRNLASLWGAIQATSGPPEVLLALLVLDVRIVLLGAGGEERTLSFPEYRKFGPNSPGRTELVLEAVLPPSGAESWALERIARTPRDEAILAAAALVQRENGKAARVCLALAGANPLPVRLDAVEKRLTGQDLGDQALQSSSKSAMRQAKPTADFRGSCDYRRAMAGLVVRRALERAWENGA